jgi:hypothetical protein
MAETNQILLERLDRLIAEADEVVESKVQRATSSYTSSYFVETGRFTRWMAASLSFLVRVFGEQHVHTRLFRERCKQTRLSETYAGKAILEAAREDIRHGFLQRLVDIVAADLFADFLEMAEHLLENGYKDPAAVMIGSVLEEHLRRMAEGQGVAITQEKNGSEIPTKTDTLNADLTKAGLYGKLDQKSVTAWLDLRNKAAHGHYSDYSSEQVKLMCQGVTDFLARSTSRGGISG